MPLLLIIFHKIMAQSTSTTLFKSVETLIPPDLWEIVGDCLEPGDQVQRLDPVLSTASKTDGFRKKIEAEYKKNLKLFWGALLYANMQPYFTEQITDFFYMRLKKQLATLKKDLTPDQHSFLQRSVKVCECPEEATAEQIRGILHHKSMKPLLSLVERLIYTPCYSDIKEQPARFSFVVNEVQCLPKLSILSLQKGDQIRGYVDLTGCKALDQIDIRRSGLTTADIKVRAPWTIFSYTISEVNILSV